VSEAPVDMRESLDRYRAVRRQLEEEILPLATSLDGRPAPEQRRRCRYNWMMPALSVTELEGRVCLNLGGFARGEGSSLQEAADDLVCSILRLVMAFRASGFRVSPEFQPDFETMDFLHELGEIAAAGGDIRSRVFA
jgi:hypothetical protein